MEAAAQSAFADRAITAKQLQEIQSDVQEFLQEFSTDPLSVIMNGDIKFTKEQKRQLAEAILREDLEESQKTPQELRAEEAERRLAELLEEKEELEAQRRTEEQSYLEQQAAVELENEISFAIESGSLPKSKYMTKKLADLAYIAYMNGIDLSMQDIIPFVKEQYKKDMREMLQVLQDDEVEELVSKERIRNIRNKQIQAVKPKADAPKSPLKTQDVGASGKKTEEKKPLKSSDFFKSLNG
jgi:flagellar biosynthesis regulator FlbT